jgi:hypothetical protein
MKRFRVVYPDYQVSSLMDFWVAMDYRSIFGGRLVFELFPELPSMSERMKAERQRSA